MSDEAAFAQPLVDPDGLRFGRLKLIGESALHYLANVEGKSATLDRGTGVHSLVLGGKRVTYYAKETASGSSAPRRGADWEQFKADNADALILSRSEYDTANRIADAVRSNNLAMQALQGVPEATLRFDFMGFPCRSTPDSRELNGAYFGELKTCRSSNPWRFRSQAKWMGYHAQMAFHREAIRRTIAGTNAKPDGFIVAVCSSPPYPVTVFRMTEKDFEAGDKLIRGWIEQLKVCIESRQFPAYAQSVVDLDIPENEELVFPAGETQSQDVEF